MIEYHPSDDNQIKNDTEAQLLQESISLKKTKKNKVLKDSYASNILEIHKTDSAMSRTVFFEAEKLEYLEGGSQEMTPDSGTNREKIDRTTLDRTVLPQDFSASVDHYTS